MLNGVANSHECLTEIVAVGRLVCEECGCHARHEAVVAVVVQDAQVHQLWNVKEPVLLKKSE